MAVHHQSCLEPVAISIMFLGCSANGEISSLVIPSFLSRSGTGKDTVSDGVNFPGALNEQLVGAQTGCWQQGATTQKRFVHTHKRWVAGVEKSRTHWSAPPYLTQPQWRVNICILVLSCGKQEGNPHDPMKYRSRLCFITIVMSLPAGRKLVVAKNRSHPRGELDGERFVTY